MAYFLGLDVGTSSAKALITDETGASLACNRWEYDICCPHAGWSQQGPAVWWEACCRAIGLSLAQLSLPTGAIAAVAVSSQMHTLVALDAQMSPVGPAILHNDARTGAQLESMHWLLGSGAESMTCNPICCGMTLPALLWLRDREPEAYARIAHVMLPADYIRLRLTGAVSTDHSNASATMAYDFETGGWSADILAALSIPAAWFPPCFDSTDPAGRVHAAAAAETGLSAGTAVYHGGADQVMQSIGCGAIHPGMATANLGSGAQVCIQTERLSPAPEQGLNAFIGSSRRRSYVMGANSNGGSAFKWVCRSILQIRDYGEMDRAIAQVRPGCDGLLFLPYLNGERCPYRNPDISGMFVGLSYLTDPARMARAVMEGVTFSLLDCLNACRATGYAPQQLIILGGGAASLEWLQIQADIYGLPVVTPQAAEQAVLGAAICAAVGAGAFPDVAHACAAMVPALTAPIVPNPQAQKLYEQYYRLYRQMYAVSRETLEQLTQLGRA